jgi:S1-C subfamily serine protease
MMHVGMLVLTIVASGTPAKTVEERFPGWLGMGYVWSSNTSGHKVLHVQKVVPGGPSDIGGMKPDDIITTINERAVDFGDDLDLLLFLADRQPGDRLTFGVVREGRKQKIRVKLGTMPQTSREAWKRNLEVARGKRLAAAKQKEH